MKQSKENRCGYCSARGCDGSCSTQVMAEVADAVDVLRYYSVDLDTMRVRKQLKEEQDRRRVEQQQSTDDLYSEEWDSWRWLEMRRKYTVTLSRTKHETARVLVEAETEEEAKRLAERRAVYTDFTTECVHVEAEKAEVLS